jgi:hypothetical protein
MARRTLQDWASIAEIVGAFAIVISLAYVAYEIRENTRALEATSRQSLADQDLEFIGSALDSSVVAVAYAKYWAGQELSNLELSQLIEREHPNFRIFENAFYQHAIGAIAESEWQRYVQIIDVVICDAMKDPATQMWQRYAPSFTPDFRNVVDEIVADCSG